MCWSFFSLKTLRGCRSIQNIAKIEILAINPTKTTAFCSTHPWHHLPLLSLVEPAPPRDNFFLLDCMPQTLAAALRPRPPSALSTCPANHLFPCLTHQHSMFTYMPFLSRKYKINKWITCRNSLKKHYHWKAIPV